MLWYSSHPEGYVYHQSPSCVAWHACAQPVLRTLYAYLLGYHTTVGTTLGPLHVFLGCCLQLHESAVFQNVVSGLNQALPRQICILPGVDTRHTMASRDFLIGVSLVAEPPTLLDTAAQQLPATDRTL